jgi:hypothetical protein
MFPFSYTNGFGIDMRINSAGQSSPEMDIARAKLSGGAPLITMVDEIVSHDTVKAQLIVDAFGTKAGIRITLKQSMASPDFRSLSTAIKGNEFSAPLRKGDVLCFNQVYADTVDGLTVAMVGPVTARTNDKLRGDVQLLTAMARPSKSSNKKASGATQYLTIVEATKAMSVGSFDDVKKAWDVVKGLKSPGGSAGFVIRDRLAKQGGDWFEKKGESIQVFIDELDQQDAFVGDALIELIPAWSVKMSRDQVAQDIDLRTEITPTIGRVGKLFDFGDKKGILGFHPCAIIIADEPETGFNSSLTGNVIRTVAGLQPCYQRKAVNFLSLPTNLREFDGKPNRVARYWSDEQVSSLKADRVSRRGPDAPITKPAAAGGGNAENDYDAPDVGFSGSRAVRMGGRR